MKFKILVVLIVAAVVFVSDKNLSSTASVQNSFANVIHVSEQQIEHTSSISEQVTEKQIDNESPTSFEQKSVANHIDIYKCTNMNGKIMYSDSACNDKDQKQKIIDTSPVQKILAKTQAESLNNAPTKVEAVKKQMYRCDGRIYCSDMNSYEEAKFFVDNCPNTRMDGDHDGEPCESQF
jgi:hypothetical protein